MLASFLRRSYALLVFFCVSARYCTLMCAATITGLTLGGEPPVEQVPMLEDFSFDPSRCLIVVSCRQA